MNWTAIANWWKRPFNIDADATSWFLFLGFVLVVIYLWTRVLHEAGHIVSEVA